MRRGRILRAFLCQLLVLALLGYGLDLNCTFIDDCDDSGVCCTDCFLPAHPTDKADHAIHLKFVGPAPTVSHYELPAVVTRLSLEVAFAENQRVPRRTCAHPTDPVRGPPV